MREQAREVKSPEPRAKTNRNTEVPQCCGAFSFGGGFELEGVGKGDCSGRDRRKRKCGGCSGDGAGDYERYTWKLDGAAANERRCGGGECGSLSEKESAAGR
jgi:hypothetical protein